MGHSGAGMSCCGALSCPVEVELNSLLTLAFHRLQPFFDRLRFFRHAMACDFLGEIGALPPGYEEERGWRAEGGEQSLTLNRKTLKETNKSHSLNLPTEPAFFCKSPNPTP